MPQNATTQAALDAARAAFRSAAITFATSTTPPLIVTLASAKAAVAAPSPTAPVGPGNSGDPVPPLFAAEAEGALYLAVKLYVDRLIAAGTYSGAPLPPTC